MLKFPQSSVARQVRWIEYAWGHKPLMMTSVCVISGAGSQLSTAVAVPVEAGSVEASQSMDTFPGQFITGSVLSLKVIIWV